MPAKSYYRKHIEEVTKESKIQKWMFATPEEDIDDPTGEIRRLKKQVQRIIPGVSGRCKLYLGVKSKFKNNYIKCKRINWVGELSFMIQARTNKG